MQSQISDNASTKTTMKYRRNAGEIWAESSIQIWQTPYMTVRQREVRRAHTHTRTQSVNEANVAAFLEDNKYANTGSCAVDGRGQMPVGATTAAVQSTDCNSADDVTVTLVNWTTRHELLSVV